MAELVVGVVRKALGNVEKSRELYILILTKSQGLPHYVISDSSDSPAPRPPSSSVSDDMYAVTSALFCVFKESP